MSFVCQRNSNAKPSIQSVVEVFIIQPKIVIMGFTSHGQELVLLRYYEKYRCQGSNIHARHECAFLCNSKFLISISDDYVDSVGTRGVNCRDTRRVDRVVEPPSGDTEFRSC